MKVIIGGTRGIMDPGVVLEAVTAAMKKGIKPTMILSGNAAGPDTIGVGIAKANNIPFQVYPAEWGRLGKRAGVERTKKMVADADAVIAVWDGQSNGTKHLIDFATERGIPVYIHTATPEYTTT